MDYIKNNLEKHSLIFKSPIDILHHMFCVLGNGIDSKTFSAKKNNKNYLYISAEYFDNLEPECVPSFLYPYSDIPRFQPFMQYSEVKNKQNVLGLQAAMKYFIKCLELTTFDSLVERKKLELVEHQVQNILECNLSIDALTMSAEQLKRLEELKTVICETQQSKLENKINEYICSREEIEKSLNEWKNAIPLMKKQFNIE